MYTICTTDILEPSTSILATFADDTAVSNTYTTAVDNLQTSLNNFHTWSRRWKILISGEKSVNTTFALRRHLHLPVYLDSTIIPYRSTVKYLAVHFDERLTFATHVITKRRELDLRMRIILRLLCRRSSLTLANKRLLYLTVLWSVRTYAISIWGCTSPSNRQLIQRFQNKSLCVIAGAPWYVRNDVLHADLRIPTVVEMIRSLSTRHEWRLHSHLNDLALALLDNSETLCSLQRRHCADLSCLS